MYLLPCSVYHRSIHPPHIATPAEVDYVHAMILNLFNGDDRYDHGRRTVSQRTLGPEYNTMRTADDGVGMLMGAALGAWGGYILGREWRLW